MICMIWIIVIAVLLVLMGIAYLRGKCDGFIAGYNTSSPEKQKKYDYLMKDSDLAATINLLCVVVMSIAAVFLANTWAKKRDK